MLELGTKAFLWSFFPGFSIPDFLFGFLPRAG